MHLRGSRLWRTNCIGRKGQELDVANTGTRNSKEKDVRHGYIHQDVGQNDRYRFGIIAEDVEDQEAGPYLQSPIACQIGGKESDSE